MGTFSEPGHDLSPRQVAELVRTGEADLVDVREAYEREAGRIEPSRHIETERLASQAETVARDRPVVFYCRLGARSAMAARAFHSAGFEAYNLDGGIQAWVDSGLPIEPDNGYVAEH